MSNQQLANQESSEAWTILSVSPSLEQAGIKTWTTSSAKSVTYAVGCFFSSESGAGTFSLTLSLLGAVAVVVMTLVSFLMILLLLFVPLHSKRQGVQVLDNGEWITMGTIQRGVTVARSIRQRRHFNQDWSRLAICDIAALTNASQYLVQDTDGPVTGLFGSKLWLFVNLLDWKSS